MVKKALILAFLMIFAVQGLVWSAPQDDQKALKKVEKIKKKADKALKSEKFDKAETLYLEALEAGKDVVSTALAPVYFSLAMAQIKQQKKEDALKNFDQAVNLNPDFMEAVNGLAQLYAEKAIALVQQQKMTEATPFLERILNLPNADKLEKSILIRSTYQLGVNYSQNMEFAKSNEMFLKFTNLPGVATEQARFYSFGIYMIGTNYGRMKNHEKSNEYLQKYLDLTQDSPPDPYTHLSNFFVGSNNFDLLQKAVAEMDKEDLEGIASLAKSKTNIVPYLDKVLNLPAGQIQELVVEQAMMKKGSYQYLCRELDQSIATYELLLQKFPNSPDKASYTTFLEGVKKSKAEKDK